MTFSYRLFTVIFSLLLCTGTHASAGVNDERMMLYDVKHYILSVKFNAIEKSLAGRVAVQGQTLKPMRQFVLSASNETLTIDSVLDGTTPLEFQHQGDHLVVPIPNELPAQTNFSFLIVYRGISKFQGQYEGGGVYFTTVKGIPRIVTSCEPNFARTWWPCKDLPEDKATISITVTVPSNLIAVSNGILQATERDSQQATYRWETRYPTATYLIAVAAAKYRQFSESYTSRSGKEMKILYYVFPEDFEKAKVDFDQTKSMLQYMENTFGEYPFIDEKFAFVEVMGNVTMENQTMVTIQDLLITGEKKYQLTFLHELAHHWWGNLITTKNWHHTWLNEGFSTYAEALYLEHRKGTPAYQQYMNTLMSAEMGRYAGTVVGKSDTVFWDSFSPRVYNKGAIVLHMLRGIVGDKTFFTIMRNFLDNPALRYNTATTEDFIRECENAYGKPLRWFFDEWLYNPSEFVDRPEYLYDWKVLSTEKGNAISLTIQQPRSLQFVYTMPLTVSVASDKGLQKFSVIDSLATQTFMLDIKGKPQTVDIDKENWVFKIIRRKESY